MNCICEDALASTDNCRGCCTHPKYSKSQGHLSVFGGLYIFVFAVFVGFQNLPVFRFSRFFCSIQRSQTPHLGTMSSGEAVAAVTLGFWQLTVASFKADVDTAALRVRGTWTRLPVGTPIRRLLFPSRTWVVGVVVVGVGWAVPLLLAANVELVVVQGWSEAGVGVVVGGAGAAWEGDAVLERCKPL